MLVPFGGSDVRKWCRSVVVPFGSVVVPFGSVVVPFVGGAVW